MALTDNIVAYWKLDEASGNAADSTANANTLTNNGTLTYAAAKINNGGVFDIVGPKYLSIAGASQTGLDISGDLSFSLWFNPSTLPVAGGFSYLLFRRSGGTGWHVTVLDTGGGTYDVSFQADGNDNPINTTFSNSTWYHLVGTWTDSSKTFQLYKNGSSLGTSNIGGTSHTTGSILFSLGQNSATRNLIGTMDEVGMWSRVLTGGEVTSLYNGGTGFQYPFSAAATRVPLKCLLGAGL